VSLSNPTKTVWQKEIVTLDQNPPVLNTLHEVFDYSGGVRLITLIVRQDNTPTNSEEIDVVITLDGGTPFLYDGSAVNTMDNASNYSVYTYFGTALTTTFTAAIDVNNATVYPLSLEHSGGNIGDALEGESIKVEVRQTSAIAAGARIRVLAIVERAVNV